MSIKIGEYVTIRNWDTFFGGARTDSDRRRLMDVMGRLVEPGELVAMEILRKNRKVWQVVSVMTENNTYNLKDEDILLIRKNYKTDILLGAVPVKWYNVLLGEQVENRVKYERDDVFDEDELKAMWNEDGMGF